jgi:hypothetical protein
MDLAQVRHTTLRPEGRGATHSSWST